MNEMVLAPLFLRVVLVLVLTAPVALVHGRATGGQFIGAQASAAQSIGASPVSAGVLTVSSWAPPGHLIREGLSAWCDELAKRARGEISCQLTPADGGAIAQAPGSVASGGVDITIAIHSLDPTRFVLTRLAELPLQPGSAEHVSVAYYRIWQRHLRKRQEHKGVRVLTVFTQTPGELYTALEPVERLTHVKGLKLSAGGGTAGQVLRQLVRLGAGAIEVPLPSAVHAISDHQLDGLLSTAGNVIRYGLTNAIAHRWQVPGGLYRHSYALLMNPAAWARLSPGAQRALDEMSGETAARIFGRAADRLEQSQLQTLLNAGLVVSKADAAELQALQQALGPIANAWLTEARDRGLANAAEVLQDFQKELRR